MNIAYDHQVFSIQQHGGVSRYLAELIGELQAYAGVHTRVIAPFHINEYLDRPQVKRQVMGCRVPAFRGAVRVVAALNSMALPMAWAGRQFDVIHETYYSTVTRGRCRARILTLHDMIHELFPLELPESQLVTAAKRAALARADHVICVSERTRQDAIRLLNLDPSRATVVHLGSSLQASSASATGFVPPSGRPYVFYVGKRDGYKNFALLLQAFSDSSLLRQEFDIVAFGGGAFSNAERRAFAAASLEGRVWQTAGDDTLLAATYRGASVFVYPSRYEGFGIPPLEAMTNDCPVVCSDAGSIAEVVGDAGIYFDPDQVHQLRGQLERVLTDAELAATMRQSGRLRIEKFSWRKCAQETLDVYRQTTVA